MHSSSGPGQGCRRQAVNDGARAPPLAALPPPAPLGLIATDEPAASALIKEKVLQRLLKFSNLSSRLRRAFPAAAKNPIKVWDQVQQQQPGSLSSHISGDARIVPRIFRNAIRISAGSDHLPVLRDRLAAAPLL